MDKKTIKVSYSCSNDKNVEVSEFEIEIYQPLKNILDEVFCLIEGRIDMTKIDSLTLNIESQN